MTPSSVSLPPALSNVIPFAVCANKKSAVFDEFCVVCARAELLAARAAANAGAAPNNVRLVVMQTSALPMDTEQSRSVSQMRQYHWFIEIATALPPKLSIRPVRSALRCITTPFSFFIHRSPALFCPNANP
jgi:hypothetical protein